MSRDGPPANSFVEPRKKGWLTKHGGTGIRANWRRRWFILDHHYIFYYTGEKERKPVGVLCLADYKWCRKATPKEGKKGKATFIIEKGEQADEMDYAVRSYLVYADSEEEMESWIEAINSEMQPVDGRRGNSFIKVDDKAFDELSTTVDEGPKLTHLTAARPKVKGRRPPRKYTPFHEDDFKEEPNEAAAGEVRVETPSPSHSPAPSPSVAKKGNRPMVPLKPKPQPKKPQTGSEEKPQTGSEEKPQTGSEEIKSQTSSEEIKPETDSEKKSQTSFEEIKSQTSSEETKPESSSEEKPQTGSKEHETSTEEPQTNTEEPQTNTEEPQTNTEEPQINTEEPQTNTQKPQTSIEERAQSISETKPRTNSIGKPLAAVAKEMPQSVAEEKSQTSSVKPQTQTGSKDKSQTDSESHDVATKSDKPSKAPPPLTSPKPRPPPATKPKKRSPSTKSTTEEVSIETVAKETKPQPPQTASSKVEKEETRDVPVTEPRRSFAKPPPPKAKPRKAPSGEQSAVATTPSLEAESPVPRPKPVPRSRVARPLSEEKRDEEFVVPASKEEESVTIATPTTKEPVATTTQVADDELAATLDEIISMTTAIEGEMAAMATAETSEEDVLSKPTIKQVAYENVILNIKDDGELTLSAPPQTTPLTNEESIETPPTSDDVITTPTKGEVDDKVIPPEDDRSLVTEAMAVPDKSETGENSVISDMVLTPTDTPTDTPTEMYKDDSLYDVPKKATPTQNDEPLPLAPPTEDEQTYDVPRSLSVSPNDIYDVPRPQTATPDYDVPRSHTPDQTYDVPRPHTATPIKQEATYDSPYSVSPKKVPSSSPMGGTHEKEQASNGQLLRADPEYDVPDIRPLAKSPPTDTNGTQSGSVASTEGSTHSDVRQSVYGPPPERDAWGYAKVNKKKSQTQLTHEPEQPQDWLAVHLQNMDELTNVPEGLQKVREILRLAKVVKAEAEEMREEAERELALARRERHDAELLKKNASEILRIAKEKLHGVS